MADYARLASVEGVALAEFEFATIQGRVRLSYEDVPEAGFAFATPLTKEFCADRRHDPSRVVFEVSLHTVRMQYGLLGARFSPADTNKLTVTTGVGSGGAFASTIATSTETTRVGLLAPFARGVIAGVTDKIEELGFAAAGELVFDRAVEGRVGSSEAFFRVLASVVAALVLTSAPEESVEALFRTEYRRVAHLPREAWS